MSGYMLTHPLQLGRRHNSRALLRPRRRRVQRSAHRKGRRKTLRPLHQTRSLLLQLRTPHRHIPLPNPPHRLALPRTPRQSKSRRQILRLTRLRQRLPLLRPSPLARRKILRLRLRAAPLLLFHRYRQTAQPRRPPTRPRRSTHAWLRLVHQHRRQDSQVRQRRLHPAHCRQSSRD